MKVLKNIMWEIAEDGSISLRNRREYDHEDDVVMVLYGSIPKNVKLDALAKRVIDNDVTLMLSRRQISEDGNVAYQMGPSGSAYQTLLHQGKIKEVKPFVVP